MSEPLRQRDALRFFVPLIFTAQLMMISHSIIHATLARRALPKIALAGFSTTHALFSVLASPTVTTPLIALSFLRDRRSVWRLLRFAGLLMLPPLLIMQLVGWTPLGNLVFGGLVGMEAASTAAAREASILFGLILPAILVRALGFGLIMLNRRTLLITYGTAVRLGSLALYLWVLPHWLEGAALGAGALLACIATEAAYTFVVARPYYRRLPLVVPGEAPTAFREVWRFSWPLMLSQFSESGVSFLIYMFLGRLAQPELALAAFGVVRGLMGLLLSPLRNLVQTVLALARTEQDVPVVWRFTLRVGLGFTALVLLLFYTPLRPVVLDGIMGLTPELSAYATPGVMLLAVVPLVWGFSATMRGLLSAARRTGAIAASSLLRVTLVVAVAALTLVAPGLNGTLVGVGALAAALLGEAGLLGWALRRRRRAGTLFGTGAAVPGAHGA